MMLRVQELSVYQHRKGHTFLMDVNEIACTHVLCMKPYDILKVMKALVKSLVYLTEYTIFRLLTTELVFFLCIVINPAKDIKFVFTVILYY
jgi:hypothetical protein